MPAYTFVEQPAIAVPALEKSDRIGVDTEFMRERTFYAQLCLVQIATSDGIYCIDPLGRRDIDDFWRALDARDWVLHSARQDIEVLYQSSGRMPAGIFDTQIAAALLGYQPQIGYANLVTELFGVELDKSHTRANWARRPLPEAILEYAAEDVEYLLPAYEELARRLEDRGRLDWAIADSAELLDPALYAVDPSAAVERLKGAKSFRGARRAAAVRLAEWREAEAQRVDRPRQWILRDSALLDIAYRLPASTRELSAIDDMPPKLVRRAGTEILAAVSEAAADEHDYEPPPRPDEAQKALLKRLQGLVAQRADELGIAAETIAAKKELSAIVAGERNSRLLRGWRRDVIGREIEALL
jgi:ribonuclease D